MSSRRIVPAPSRDLPSRDRNGAVGSASAETAHGRGSVELEAGAAGGAVGEENAVNGGEGLLLGLDFSLWSVDGEAGFDRCGDAPASRPALLLNLEERVSGAEGNHPSD